MLVPLRLSGWAQVALTPACSRRDTNQPGSHWSWQSHRKLPLWMRLEKKGGPGGQQPRNIPPSKDVQKRTHRLLRFFILLKASGWMERMALSPRFLGDIKEQSQTPVMLLWE